VSAWSLGTPSTRSVSLLQCFIDVDGEPLVDRLVGLCREAQRVQRDIWFQ
jgi:hypothetical protein